MSKKLNVIYQCIVLFQHNDGSFFHNLTGNKLQLSDIIKSVTDGGRFYCQVGNMIGTSSVSLAATVNVESMFI